MTKKRVSQGGFEPTPTRSFSTKSYFSTQLYSAKSESYASKDQAIRWFQQARAFDTVKPNKSYAQALLCNVDSNVLSYPRVEKNLGATDNMKLGIAGNNQGYSSAHTVAKIHKVPYVKLSSKAQSQPSSKLICKKQNRYKKQHGKHVRLQ